MNRFRRRILRTGSFSLKLPWGEELPPWADIAISFLKSRRGWRVLDTNHSGYRWFVVESDRLGRRWAGIPDVLKPSNDN